METKLSKNNWFNLNEVRNFADSLGEKLGYKSHEDWYQITRKDIVYNGGHGVLKRYNASPYEFVSKTYSEFDWKPWLFKYPIRNFWRDDKYTVDLIKWIELKLDIKDISQWYQVSMGQIRNLKMNIKFSSTSQNIFDVLKKVYPHYDWKDWLFEYMPVMCWDDRDIQIEYFQWLREHFNIGDDPSEWYGVMHHEFPYFCGLIHRMSKFDFIKSMYPNYDWKIWLCRQAPSGFWHNKNNHRSYGLWFEDQLNISDPKEWYNISQDDFHRFNGGSLISMYYAGSPKLFVMTNFPEYNLDETKFKKLRKGQSILYKMVKNIFSQEEVLWEYKHPEIISSLGRKLELDIFIPKLKIAFEYQGQQHYGKKFHNLQSNKSMNRLKENDALKIKRCKELGIRLYGIPFNWNRKESYIRELLGLNVANNV